jgi:hypothetical protein
VRRSRGTTPITDRRASDGAPVAGLKYRAGQMESIVFALIVVAVVGLIIWRGVALYNYGLRKKDL